MNPPNEFLARATVLLAVTMLSACGTISEETAASFTAAPGRYDTYACNNIEAQMKIARGRNNELEQLMARASQDTGGAVIGAMAYRTEYIQNKGRMQELVRVSRDKKCAVENSYSSGRSIY